MRNAGFGIICAMDTILYFQSPAKTSAPDKIAGVRRFAKGMHWHVQEIEGLPSQAALSELIAFWNPLGAILECGGGFHEIPYEAFSCIPTVFLDRNPLTLPQTASCVSHDSVATGRLAAKELLQTNYANFAYTPFPEQRFWSEDRKQGFMEALSLNGRTCVVFDGGDAEFSSPGYQARLREWLAALPRPCGLFAANDRVATEVLTAAACAGIKVPSELAVVGVDNFAPICEHTIPPLTSIQPDFIRAGELTAQTMRDLLESGGKRTFRLTFGPVCVVRRASSRVLRRYDPQVTAALELIRNKACEGLTAKEALAAFSCSRRKAELRFREAVGRSVLDEIQAVRIAHAKEMLRNPRQDLKSLADFCGYKRPNSLAKIFRATTGMSMRKWRAEAGRSAT